MFFRLFVSSVSLLILYAAPPAISDPTDVTTEAGGDFVIADGDLVVLDGRNTVRVRIDSDTGSYFAHDEEGRRSVHIDQPGANLVLGGSGGGREDDDGDLVIFSNRASEHDVNDAAIHLDGGAGAVRVGGGGEPGLLVLRTRTGRQRILLDARSAALVLGNGGQGGAAGHLEMRAANGATTIDLEADSGEITAERLSLSGSGAGGREGIDSATLFLSSNNPSLALLDDTAGNRNGWYIQSGTAGQLVFQTGTPDGIGQRVMVLDTDGSVCLGACD